MQFSVKGTQDFWKGDRRGQVESKQAATYTLLFFVVQSLNLVWLSVTSWTSRCQALFLTISWSVLKFKSIEFMILPKHLIFCCPLLLLLSIFPSITFSFFPTSWLFTSGGKSTGASALASVLSMNIRGCFPLWLTSLISLQSQELSRVSSITIQKHQFFGT